MESTPERAAAAHRRLLVVAAHPDDELIGAFALVSGAQAHVVHLTDGAPRQSQWWPEGVAPTREEYAQLRRREAEAALARAGVEPKRVHALSAPDQESVHHVRELVRAVARILRRVKPEVVLAHAYEGGHPDHDTAALVARAAVRLAGAPGPWEMASYHARGDRLEVLDFLPADAPVWTLRFSGAEQQRKAAALSCYRSQRQVLEMFPLGVERFRPAPPADFTAPPHPGRLWYEAMGWEDGAAWRAEAARALRALCVDPRDPCR